MQVRRRIMIGERLGAWRVQREIGRGGMGSVYLAVADPVSADGPACVAIKVLAPELAVDPGFTKRFQREIEILRQLNHPNIVRFLESGVHGVRPYYVMEYVDGRTLQDVLERKGRMPWLDVLELALQLAPALKHAHDRGIIHRDIKPANLLLSSREEHVTNGEQKLDGAAPGLGAKSQSIAPTVKLSDFGIASLFAGKQLTITGSIVGTAEYLSPEQAQGKPVTQRSDLYSFGVVLYTLLTGRTPFAGEPAELLHKHLYARFDRPARVVPDIPHDLDAIVCELLEKDPAQRPADAGILARRLASLRRKIERRTRPTDVALPYLPESDESEASRPGPATLIERLLRVGRARRQASRYRRPLERPLVLLVLLAVTLGLLAWAFWPLSPETMFRRGAELMKSTNPDDWETAWDRYLGPLVEQHPDHGHQEEIAEFKRRVDERRAVRAAENAARVARPMSEVEWIYQRGLQQRQNGDEAAARRTWQALTSAFRDVPTEAAWVKLAEKRLAETDPTPPERRWEPVRAALRRARQLRDDGKDAEAKALLEALEELYRDDPQAKKILRDASCP
jgi:serine/threonine protein kinase